MTWADFIESEYNVGNKFSFYTGAMTDDEVTAGDGSGLTILTDEDVGYGDFVYSTDPIVPNAKYVEIL